MNAHRCCQQPAPRDEQRPPAALELFHHAAKWGLPGALLVAMPKCPACVAAYCTVFTGVGLSLSAAAHLRILLLSLCAATLVVLTAKRIWTIASRPATP